MPQTYLQLDDAWGATPNAWQETGEYFTCIDARWWGPRLRYHGPRQKVEAFYREIESRLTPFVLYGSGDYHYLAGVLVRRLSSPVTVVSFDNHPDWDVRPPHWSCGGWVNRALEMAQVRRVSVWGCGNFELGFPARLFANHRALRAGRLEVHAWAERQPDRVRRRFGCMTREKWREDFERFTQTIAGQDVYVTVDLDCLRAQEAITNWENGLFAAEDVAWALRSLHREARVVGGDLCGAYSEPQYARRFQRFAARWDHPRITGVSLSEARPVNEIALKVIWPALAGQPAAEPV